MALNLAGIHTSLDAAHFVFKMRREGVVEVPVETLDRILTAAKAPAPIDFVSIDVENPELEVLSGFDLDRWRPKLLLIEDLVKDLRMHRYLQAQGYKWIRRTSINGWYIPADSQVLHVSLLGQLQFLRKYYLGLPFRRLRETLRRLRAARAARARPAKT
jgi:hypothetical protein